MIKEFQPEDSPEKLASELGEMRSRVDEKIRALQDDLAPSHLLDLAVDKLSPVSGKTTADTVRISAIRAGHTIRQYPLTTAFVLGGLFAWLIEAGRTKSPAQPRETPPPVAPSEPLGAARPRGTAIL